jgi:hypothetical protein
MTTKHTIVTVSLALVAFVFGCVTEALVVPPVQAGPEAPPIRASTNATRWEYKCLHTSDPEEDGVANKLGAQGWELAAVGDQYGNRWCFKRPLP